MLSPGVPLRRLVLPLRCNGERMNQVLPAKSRVRSRLMLALATSALLLAGAGGFFTYQVRQVPEFYEQAIAAQPTQQIAAGQQFEQQALEVQNQIRRAGEWRAEISDSEINGWLATVLPEKFASLLPPEVSEPRVAIQQDRLLMAAKYRTSGIETVVSLELSAFLTDEPNVVAVQIHRVAAGNVPLPVGKYLEQITEAAAKRGVYIRWQEVAGDPLAVVQLPRTEPGDKREIRIHSLGLLPGKAIVAGTVEERPLPEKGPAPAQPAVKAAP